MPSSSARPWRRRAVAIWLASVLAAASVVVAPVAHIVQPATAAAASSFADPHFTETTVFSTLTMPTTVRFATDGRAFVAEKRGIIKAYDSIDDSSATQVLDIRTDVHDFWDRGLLSIALDPDFLTGRPYIYLYYDYDAPPGQTAPIWNDTCPTPPGATTDGCVVRSKVDRYTVNLTTNVANPASRLNLIGDGVNGEWCQQFPSHAGGALAFDSDGMLLVTGGDGASFGGMDWGQLGGHAGSPTPVNPCGDPVPSQANAEGGMLRSQDVRTQADATGLDGAIARIDPDTGNAPADNPMKDFAGADANTKRIVATGLRNPFRITFRPGHNDLYVGDVGNQTWEEVDRWTMSGSTPTNIPNFGWPCYEGVAHQAAFENLGTSMCAALYAQEATAQHAIDPLYMYTHIGTKTPKGPCFPGSANQTSSISGLAFYEGASGASVDYPSKYDGALFFVDYSRDCLGAILPLASGIPDPSQVEQVASGVSNPVDLATGPGGDLYYVDHNGGRVVRVKYVNAPIARATATPASGVAPISIHLDGSTSTEPDSDFAIDGWDWDFYNDGSFDASGSQVDWQIDTPGQYEVKLRVHSTSGLTDTKTIQVDTANSPPQPVIDTPDGSLTWSVGDTVQFTGHASDDEDGALTGSHLQWQAVMVHCPAGCHEHPPFATDSGVSGSFVAPDHEYPSHIELRLTATDSDGASTTVAVDLDPETATIDLASTPAGIPITVGNTSNPAPWSLTVIKGGEASINGPLTRTIGGKRYRFSTWNGSHHRVRDLTVTGDLHLTATYVPDAQDSCTSVTANSPKQVAIAERSSGNDDADWFQFHIGHKRDVRITLDNLPVKGRLDLYKSCATLLASSNNPGTQAETLKRQLSKGTYRIRVTSPDNGWSASPYSLLIRPLPR